MAIDKKASITIDISEDSDNKSFGFCITNHFTGEIKSQDGFITDAGAIGKAIRIVKEDLPGDIVLWNDIKQIYNKEVVK